MKKWTRGIAAAILILCLGTMSAFAAGQFHGRCYVDADGDGVCDHWGQGGCGVNYVDADGDGVCDNWGHGGCGLGTHAGHGGHRGWRG